MTDVTPVNVNRSMSSVLSTGFLVCRPDLRDPGLGPRRRNGDTPEPLRCGGRTRTKVESFHPGLQSGWTVPEVFPSRSIKTFSGSRHGSNLLPRGTEWYLDFCVEYIGDRSGPPSPRSGVRGLLLWFWVLPLGVGPGVVSTFWVGSTRRFWRPLECKVLRLGGDDLLHRRPHDTLEVL